MKNMIAVIVLVAMHVAGCVTYHPVPYATLEWAVSDASDAVPAGGVGLKVHVDSTSGAVGAGIINKTDNVVSLVYDTIGLVDIKGETVPITSLSDQKESLIVYPDSYRVFAIGTFGTECDLLDLSADLDFVRWARELYALDSQFSSAFFHERNYRRAANYIQDWKNKVTSLGGKSIRVYVSVRVGEEIVNLSADLTAKEAVFYHLSASPQKGD